MPRGEVEGDVNWRIRSGSRCLCIHHNNRIANLIDYFHHALRQSQPRLRPSRDRRASDKWVCRPRRRRSLEDLCTERFWSLQLIPST